MTKFCGAHWLVKVSIAAIAGRGGTKATTVEKAATTQVKLSIPNPNFIVSTIIYLSVFSVLKKPGKV
jgi:uncharacterized protein (UPF0261 family)